MADEDESTEYEKKEGICLSKCAACTLDLGPNRAHDNWLYRDT